jgi:hypothetical protein
VTGADSNKQVGGVWRRDSWVDEFLGDEWLSIAPGIYRLARDVRQEETKVEDDHRETSRHETPAERGGSWKLLGRAGRER